MVFIYVRVLDDLSFILALQEKTFLSIHMEYNDHFGCRNEYIELRPGEVFIFAGNQPHAGCAFMHDNLRIHWYSTDPGGGMVQSYVFPGTYENIFTYTKYVYI